MLIELLVRQDIRLILLGVDAVTELMLIQSTLPRHSLEDRIRVVRRLPVPRIMRLEERVVHLPELPLLIRACSGAGGRPRVAVYREREIDPAEANDSFVDEPAPHVRLRERREP